MTDPAELVDIGVNLTNKSFAGDRDAVIQRAREAGVTRMVVTGTSIEDSIAASELAATHPGLLFSTAGVHPHNAKDCDEETLDQLSTLAKKPHVVAIGECGLDFNRDFSPRPDQRQWFEAQVQLASELQMPLFVHEREAGEVLTEVLCAHRDNLPRAVVHCFTGDGATLDAYLDLDLHIGITGWICDERRGVHLHELVKRIPLDRLMIETDAPYLLPRSIRPRPKSRRNEPSHLPHVLQKISECLGIPPDELAARTTETAIRFFGL